MLNEHQGSRKKERKTKKHPHGHFSQGFLSTFVLGEHAGCPAKVFRQRFGFAYSAHEKTKVITVPW